MSGTGGNEENILHVTGSFLPESVKQTLEEHEARIDELEKENESLWNAAVELESERNSLKWLLLRINRAHREADMALHKVAEEPLHNGRVREYAQATDKLRHLLEEAGKV